MNPRERVDARLKGEPVDKVPNLNIVMMFAADLIGVPYSRYITDHRCLVEGNIECCRRFGIDMVSVISDPYREAGGFGATIELPYDSVPLCKNVLLKEYGDIKKLRVADPKDDDRMYDRIKAVDLYRQLVADEYHIMGWVEGPLAEAADLRGINEICFDFADNPGWVEELMELCLENAIRFAGEQIKAGATFIGIGDAAASVMGRNIYEQFVVEREARLIEAIHRMGAKVKLHICGDITALLPVLPRTGADIVDIDFPVDFARAVECLGSKMTANGNFDPVRVLLQGSVADVGKAVRACVEKSISNTMISAGCEVPRNTPHENLREVHRVLMEYAAQG